MRTQLTTGGTIVQNGPLHLAQGQTVRQPSFAATARDIRLRFSLWTQQTNPWSLADDALIGSRRFCFGRGILLSNGKIVRAWVDNGGTVRVNWIDTPTTASHWGQWHNTTIQASNSSAYYSSPALAEEGGQVYLYVNNVSNGNIRIWRCPITATHGTQAWTFFENVAASGTSLQLAAISGSELYAVDCSLTEQQRIIRYIRSGTWSSAEMPWRYYGNSKNSIPVHDYSSGTFFDAFVLGGNTHIIYSHGSAGQCWVTRFSGGVWSDAIPVLPADYYKFIPYRVTVIQGTAWLTGRVIFDSADSTTGKGFDCVLRSTNGLEWTALDRECYLCTPELRGKLFQVGDYVYYAGIYSIYRSDTTFLSDPAGDPAGKRVALTEDVKSASVTLPGLDNALGAGIELATTGGKYIMGSEATIVAPGSEVWIEGGYVTTAGEQRVLLGRFGIDAVQDSISTKKAKSLTLRDAALKRMRDYSSPFYHRWLSQEKTHDEMDDFSNWAGWGPGVQWKAGTGGFAGSQEFSSLYEEAIYASSVVTDTLNFDVRALWSNTWTANANSSTFGLIGLMKDKDNFIRAEVRLGQTPRIRLVKRFNNTDTELANVDPATLGITFTSGTRYWLRFIHRSGRLRVYVRAESNTTWTLALNHLYVGNELLCPTDNGRGYVGFYAVIRPYRFFIHAIDKFAAAVAMKSDPDGHFSQISIPADIRIDSEIMRATVRSNLARTPPSWAGVLGYQAEWPGRPVAWYQVGDNYFINHLLYFRDVYQGDVFGTSGGYARGYNHLQISGATVNAWESLIFAVPEHGAAFRIRGSAPSWTNNWSGGPNYTNATGHEPPGGAFVICSNEGYVTNRGLGIPSHVIPSDRNGAAIGTGVITWGLYGITRGFSGTQAAYHASDTPAYVNCDNVIRVWEFQIHDIERDNNNEDLLRRACWLVGVPATFANTYSNSSVNASAGNVWLADVRNGTLEFTTPAGGGAILRSASQNYPTSGVAITVTASNNVNFFRAGSIQQVVPLPQTPTFPVRVRLVWHTKTSGAFSIGWFSVYVNDMYVATFVNNSDNGNATNWVGLLSGFTYTNVRIPELGEWRDGVRVDESRDVISVLKNIIQDRPIGYLSRSGESVFFSQFDTRSQHWDALSSLVLSEDRAPQDTEIMTAARMEADQVGVFFANSVAGQDWMRQHGFVFRNLQMPDSHVSDGTRVVGRVFRRMAETVGYRSYKIRADVIVEPEDRQSVNFTTPDGTVTRTANLIVNDLKYEYKPGKFLMSAGYREFIE